MAARVVTGDLDLDARRDHVFSYLPVAAQKGSADFETRWEPCPTFRPEPPPTFAPDPGQVFRIRARHPKPDSAWEADAFYLPATVTDRDRPYFARFVLLAKEMSGFVIHAVAVEPEKPLSQVLGDALVASLTPLRKTFGIRLKVKRHLGKIMEARRHLELAMQSGGISGVS